MRLEKLVVGIFCAGILAAQVYTGFSTVRSNDWYWPFVNYPMYAESHARGDSVILTELRALPCDGDGESKPVTLHDLRITWMNFERYKVRAAGLRGATPRQSRSAAEFLSRMAVTHLHPAPCALGVWARTYVIGPAGPETLPGDAGAGSEWLVRSWPIAGYDTIATVAEESR